MTRVLRIVTRLNRGGPLRQLEALVPGLVEEGWSGPVVVGRVEPHERDGRDALVRAGADVVDVPALGRGIGLRADRRALRALRDVVRDVRPDIVHTHLGKAGALGRMAAHRLDVPAVHTFHGHHFARAGWVGRLARLAERRLARKTAAWITLSARQHRDVTEVVGGAAAARVHLVPPGFDVASFAALAPPAAATPVRVLWSGRHVPVKNVAYLLEAFTHVPAPTTLTLLGGGPQRADAARAAAQVPRVALRDEVDDPRPVLAEHHIAVLGSTHEGTPLALLEAMAAGRPVVATAVGGIPDIVRDGETGLLVAPQAPAQALGAAVTRLVDDAALRARLGAAAAADVAARFGAARLARETAQVYEAVLAARRA